MGTFAKTRKGLKVQRDIECKWWGRQSNNKSRKNAESANEELKLTPRTEEAFLCKQGLSTQGKADTERGLHYQKEWALIQECGQQCPRIPTTYQTRPFGSIA
jgi:hypothetical protein